MLTVEYSLPDIEELARLVEAGQEKGFLTYDEIATVLEEVEISKEQVEDLHSYLIDHGIDVARERRRSHAGGAGRREGPRSSTSRSSPRSTRCVSTCAPSAASRC